MSYPEDLYYTKSHEWVRVDGDTAIVGISWFAQDSLGDVVHYEAPSVGDTVSAGDAVAEIESVKAVSDVYTPLDGEVTAVNEDLDGNEEAVNSDPYGDGWLFKVKLADKGQLDGLMKVAAYKQFVDEQS